MKFSTKYLFIIVFLAFALLGTLLLYTYKNNNTIILEKINVNQTLHLHNIAKSIELDIQQLRDEMLFLSQLDSFNDLVINDLDKRILQILNNKKSSQKFDIELYIENAKKEIIAQTGNSDLDRNRGIVLNQKIHSSLQKDKYLGTLLVYIPYKSFKIYLQNTSHHYTLKDQNGFIKMESEKKYSDNTHLISYSFSSKELKGLRLESSLSQKRIDTLLYSKWTYISIVTIFFISALLVFALFYSYKLYMQREVLQKNQLKLLEEANQATQVKSRFISQMSHEFRTPLNSIIGFSQFLSQEKLVQQEYEKLPLNIEKAGKHLLTLVENILSISQEEFYSKTKTEPKLENIIQLSDDVITLLKIQGEKKALKLRFTSSVESFHMLIDKTTYQQVLFNLIGNAIKYTNEGSVSLNIQVEAKYVTISIKDTGIGMEDTSQIFNPFVRLENSANVKGSGLGLALVDAYIHKLGSSIEVFSEGKNKGSEFTFKLTI